MNQGVKTNLAKLLATENLVVEHKNVETASFDVRNRVLTLPIWEVSDTVYDMLVGHEVGHALYTPVECDAPDVPGSFINVVEDARIERMMKTTYPGLNKSFSRGYKELNEKDFFEIKDKDLKKEYSLIDRINVYFKLGIHDVTCIVPFDVEEQEYVELCRKAVTFEDVINAAAKIYEFMKSKKTEDKKPDQDVSLVDQGSSGTSSQQVETEPSQSNSEDSDSKESSDNTKGNDDTDLDTPSYDGGQAEEETVDEFEVKTEESFNRNQKQIISDEKWEYITPPVVNWENHITYNDEYVDDMLSLKEKISTKHYFSGSTAVFYGSLRIDRWKTELNTYIKESSKSVSYLVKEFEMKKSAKEYNRSFVSKTGVLDTNKIYSYQWNEDLFKKSNVVPSGKNHGLLMFVDWSGSMSTNIVATMKQLLNLVQFCKKSSIPFEVYSFVENGSEVYERMKGVDRSISVGIGYRLIQLFSSQRGSAKIDKQIEAAWILVNALKEDLITYKDEDGRMKKYDMGSTPLNETIFSAIYLYNKFRKNFSVEKVNTVFLTDGESNQLCCNVERYNELTDENYIVRRPANRMYGTYISFRDPKSGYQHHKLCDPSYSNGYAVGGIHVTAHLMEYYRWMTGSNLIGYRICDSIPSMLQKAGSYDYDDFRKEWKKNQYIIEKNLGYSELYAIRVNSDFAGETQEINANSSSTQSKLRNEFKKHLKGKSFNKIILSKFVDQIA